MEGELWAALYPLVIDEDKRRRRRPRVQYGDATILLVALWAVLHDRPIGWACDARHWAGVAGPPWLALPAASTMSTRLRTLAVQHLLEQVLLRLLTAVTIGGFCLCRRVDAKPLPVGAFSKDRDARRGHVSGGVTCRGYKLFGCWGTSPVVPEAVVLGPMNESDPAGAMELIERLQRLHGGAGTAGGYLLMDATHDTNALHDYAAARGFQPITPRKTPGTGLGHRDHSPHRLRSIELLEGAPATALNDFGPALYAGRGQVERDFGHAGSFGGGLQPLPNFVRRPRRVALWVIGKLIINGLRICRKQGLTS
jgi:Transposase DDE domain